MSSSMAKLYQLAQTSSVVDITSAKSLSLLGSPESAGKRTYVLYFYAQFDRGKLTTFP